MDLLGNYSSSDDDDDSSNSSERSRSPPTPIVKKTSSLLQIGTLPSSVPSPQKPAAIKAAVAMKKAVGGGTSRRGKKLISLHSVLPPHILEQLTKSEATGDFEDSSDDEEEISSSTSKKNKRAPRKDSSSSKSATSKDEGITNFLSALGSAKTKGALKVNKNTTTSSIQKEKSQSSSSSSGEGKLGAAFLSVTTTTTTRKKKDGTQSSTTTTTTTTTNTTTDPRSTPTSQQEAHVDSPSHYTPLSLSPRTAFHPFPNSKVSAAPPIPSSRLPAPAPAVVQQYDNTPRQVVAPPPPPVMADYGGGVGFHNTSLDTMSGSSGAASSRSKKRQLQKALRAGNLDHALATAGGAAHVTNLDQAKPTAYVPEPETYATPAHGVRVVATTMYNPKAGADVQANMGAVRARGKNQINQLMASAANFELQQARSGQKNNNQRAGAKRKYGW